MSFLLMMLHKLKSVWSAIDKYTFWSKHIIDDMQLHGLKCLYLVYASEENKDEDSALFINCH